MLILPFLETFPSIIGIFALDVTFVEIARPGFFGTFSQLTMPFGSMGVGNGYAALMHCNGERGALAP